METLSVSLQRLEREGERVYFVADGGIRYRVHDAAFGVPPASPHKTKRLPFGDVRATSRYFVTADGKVRIHSFAKGENRALTVELLARQLLSAGYAAKEKFDASKHAPR